MQYASAVVPNGGTSPYYTYTLESLAYNVNGQLTSMNWSNGNTIGPSSNYGNFGGLTGGVQYAYAAGANNGQITGVTDSLSGETVSYQYDQLKRLTSATSVPTSGSSVSGWTQNFSFDGFGNLTGKTLNGTTTSIAVNGATNQLSSAGYDANGNMTSGAGVSLTYDEANRVAWASPKSGGTEYYGYAPDNKRIYRRASTGTEELTWYGAKGEKLAVFQIGGNSLIVTSRYVWFAGKLILDGNGVFQDRLGTNRAGGARYLPFGEELTSTAGDHVKFGTYNRDSFTGLDYADQRMYASTYGRFTSPDRYAGSAGPGVPLSWNRYAYVLGDPVNSSDQHGTHADCEDGCDFADCDGDPYSCELYQEEVNQGDVGGGDGANCNSVVATDGCSVTISTTVTNKVCSNGLSYASVMPFSPQPGQNGFQGSCDNPIGTSTAVTQLFNQVGNNLAGFNEGLGVFAGGSILLGGLYAAPRLLVPDTLYHYTTVAGAQGIAANGSITPGLGLTGVGVYGTAGGAGTVAWAGISTQAVVAFSPGMSAVLPGIPFLGMWWVVYPTISTIFNSGVPILPGK